MAKAKARATKRTLPTKLLAGAGIAVVAILVIVFALSRVGSDKDLARAFENLAKAQSFSTEAELILHLPRRLRGGDRPFTEIRSTVVGDVRRGGSGTAELTGKLSTEARGRGNVFFADGDVRVLENEVLFLLDNLPVFLNRSGSLVNRWTRVEAALLKTNNMGDIRTALGRATGELTRAGSETIDGERLVRFAGRPTAEAEEALVQLLDRQSSGSPAWHVLARLLRANNVDSLEVWVDASSAEVRRIRAHFVRPLSGDRTFDFAQLTLTFKDYGREVAIERPEPVLAVQPHAFAQIFGQGEAPNIEADQPSQ
jgi:hypothetical protein